MNTIHVKAFIFLSYVGNESAFLFTVIIIIIIIIFIIIVAVVPWEMLEDWVLTLTLLTWRIW